MTTQRSSKRQQLRKLLACKQLRDWTVNDVIIWLSQVNDSNFAQYIPNFVEHEINGQQLMNLTDETQAAQILGTHHQIRTFTVCITSLKIQSVKKYKHNNNNNIQPQRQLNLAPTKGNRIQNQYPQHSQNNGQRTNTNATKNKHSTNTSSAHNQKRPPMLKHAVSTSSLLHSSAKKFNFIRAFSTDPRANNNNNNNSKRDFMLISKQLKHSSQKKKGKRAIVNRSRRGLSTGDVFMQFKIAKSSDQSGNLILEITDKKLLWKSYQQYNIYNGFLFKKGQKGIGKIPFKKRWFILCSIPIQQRKHVDYNDPNANATANDSGSVSDNDNNNDSDLSHSMNISNMLNDNRNHKQKKLKTKKGYMFYFRQRPVSDMDFPLGYIDLQKLQQNGGIIGMFDELDDDDEDEDAEAEEDNHKHKKNKADDSYYQFVLKCVDRDWILGALDANTYIQWMTRLKHFS